MILRTCPFPPLILTYPNILDEKRGLVYILLGEGRSRNLVGVLLYWHATNVS